VPYDGFFQNNLFLTDILVDEVRRLAISSPINTLVDAYCGCGLFSIFLASHAKKIIGIEINEKSIKFACLNAEKENINNAEFIQGDVAKVLTDKIITSAGSIDLIILDPPRIGCSTSLLSTIADLRPQSLIYISCNPATQARDVHFLTNNGYKLLSLLPVDMFPQTQHIEVIGLLKNIKNK
jgi:23S rRNA (uracil1939-C5)-methyltransferase